MTMSRKERNKRDDKLILEHYPKPWPKKTQKPKEIKRVKFEGYHVVTEIHDNLDHMGSAKKYAQEPGRFLVMRSAYTPDGHYIGNSKDGKRLCKDMGLTLLQPKEDGHVCCVGWSPKEYCWYGWSHRAICGFRIGDKLFDESFVGDERTPFRQHGHYPVEHVQDSFQAAHNFAESVS